MGETNILRVIDRVYRNRLYHRCRCGDKETFPKQRNRIQRNNQKSHASGSGRSV